MIGRPVARVVVASFLFSSLLAACGEQVTELSYKDSTFAWRFVPSETGDKPVKLDWIAEWKLARRLNLFTIGDQVFVVDWRDAISSLERTAQILRIEGSGTQRSVKNVGPPIKFAGSQFDNIHAVRGPAQGTRRLLTVHIKKVGEPNRRGALLGLLTLSADGAIVGRTEPQLMKEIYGVMSVWEGRGGDVLVAGIDSETKKNTLRIILLDKEGRAKWKYRADGVNSKKPYISPWSPVFVKSRMGGGYVILGSDAHWNEDVAVRYLYELTLDGTGNKISNRSLLDMPESTASRGAIRGYGVRFRPEFSNLRRRADGSFVGNLNNWYKGQRRALRVFSIAPDFTLGWVRELTDVERPKDGARLGLAHNGTILAYGIIEGEETEHRLFHLSSTGKLLARYRLKDLRIEHIWAHPRRGFLIAAIHKSAKDETRAAIVHFDPPKPQD